MKTIHSRLARTGLVLAMALSVGTGVAHAVTREGSSNSPATTATSETITSGTITSIDAKRGVMAVSGRVIHFTTKATAFSDDRKQVSPDGLEGLKPGDKVTVRSVMREGGNQAIQIVVKD
jgi:ribosomal protein S1